MLWLRTDGCYIQFFYTCSYHDSSDFLFILPSHLTYMTLCLPHVSRQLCLFSFSIFLSLFFFLLVGFRLTTLLLQLTVGCKHDVCMCVHS